MNISDIKQPINKLLLNKSELIDRGRLFIQIHLHQIQLEWITKKTI